MIEKFIKIIPEIDSEKLNDAIRVVKSNLKVKLKEHEIDALVLFAYYLPFKAMKLLIML